MSRHCWVDLPRGSMGLSVVSGCGVSCSYSLYVIKIWCLWMFKVYSIKYKSVLILLTRAHAFEQAW